MIARTGGLVAYTPLTFSGVLDNRNLRRLAADTGPIPLEDNLAAERSLLDWVFAQGTLRSGDVLIIGSVSGTSWRVVELALQSRTRGLTVIAITAPAFSGHLAAAHPSGKRLFEVADIVLDLGGHVGDAAIHLEGLDQPVGPTSSAVGTAVLHGLMVEVAAQLLERGIEPPVFRSANLDGADERNAALVEAYRGRLSYL